MLKSDDPSFGGQGRGRPRLLLLLLPHVARLFQKKRKIKPTNSSSTPRAALLLLLPNKAETMPTSSSLPIRKEDETNTTTCCFLLFLTQKRTHPTTQPPLIITSRVHNFGESRPFGKNNIQQTMLPLRRHSDKLKQHSRCQGAPLLIDATDAQPQNNLFSAILWGPVSRQQGRGTLQQPSRPPKHYE